MECFLFFIAVTLLVVVSACVLIKNLRFHIKNTAFALVFLAIGTVVSIKSLRRPGDVRNMKWWRYATHFLRVGKLLNLEIKGENLEVLNNEEACVILSNHQSEMDQIALVDVWNHIGGRCTILGKESIKYMGTLGLGCLLSGVVFVDRKNREKSRRCMAECVRRMRDEKLKLWLYPEGTRSRNLEVDMLEFKKGAFHMAIQAQVPIIPVVMSCYKHMYNVESRTFKKVSIRLIGLSPFETKGLTEEDIPDLIKNVRDCMLSTYRTTVPPEIRNFQNDHKLSALKLEQNGNKLKEHEQ